MRAAIGIAETPELPISGFTFPPLVLLSSFAIRTPPIVPKQKAANPKKTIKSVCGVKNLSAVAEAPMERATNRVKIFSKLLWSVSI